MLNEQDQFQKKSKSKEITLSSRKRATTKKEVVHNGKNDLVGLTLKEIKPITIAQNDVFSAYNEGYNLFLHGMAGTGKAQPLDAKILTKIGWVYNRDIKIGDEVVTPSGKYSKVIGVFPQGNKQVFQIMLHDGRYVEATNEHLWKVKEENKEKIVNTEYINNYFTSKRGKRNRLYLPLIEPLKENKENNKELIITPYLMGCLIGDGCLYKHTITLTSYDQEIIDKCSDSLDINYIFHKHKAFGTFGLSKRKRGCITNIYNEELKKVGLYNKRSDEKFIPDEYMNLDYNDKMELIRGLMDTDGTVDAKAKSASFCTTSKRLSEQMQELIWSIGGICKVTTKIPHFTYKGIKKQGKLSYIVNIRIKDSSDLFSLERKKLLGGKTQYSDNLRVRIVGISALNEEKECQCILIDDPDHLYITDNYIVTHNTFLTTYLGLKELIKNPHTYEKIIIVRSAVSSRDVGFLPGNIKEKMMAYEEPYAEISKELFDRGDAYDILKAKGKIVFTSSSFLRGITFRNAIVIIDEVQNFSKQECITVMTRIGQNCKVIICGDNEQDDLVTKKNDISWFDSLHDIVYNMKSFDMIQFQIEDIVRSSFVKEFLIAKHNIKK